MLAMLTCASAAAVTTAPSAITAPAAGSKFSGSTVTFAWSAGTGVSEYRLFVGTKGVGTYNLYASAPTVSRSLPVSNVPRAGLKVYVRLNSLINGAWQSVDYTFTEAGSPVSPAITSPTPGATLSGSSVMFTWSAGVGPSAFKLLVGSTGVNSSNLYNSGSTTNRTISVSNLPQGGTKLYVQLSWLMDTTWYSANYTYIAAAGSTPALTGFSCTTGSLTGSGTDACTITLNHAASSSGFVVKLASNDASVTVPASVTVASGSASVGFSATIAAVSSAQTATITATAGTVSKTFAIQLAAAVPTLTINAASIAFGDVTLNTPATQSLTLTSSGTAPVLVSSITISGAGFSLGNSTLPLTLNPKQTSTLSVQFDPTTAKTDTGTLTITSNSSSKPTATVALTGIGEAATAYSVDLTWAAPSSSPDPVAKYNIYRTPSGGSSYQLMGTVSNTQLAYTDSSSVNSGQTYDYIVESVDSSGNESVPSNMASVTIP
jgi:hypothetical protein